MGREAMCECHWATTKVPVKALLESTEIVLRGELKKRLPFSELKELTVKADRLCFTVADDPVQLLLGAAEAKKWAASIQNPPTLARKLGITSKTAVRIIGNIDDEGLKEAIAEAGQAVVKDPGLIIACVETPESLQAALRDAREHLLHSVPIWIVYPKGAGHPLNESSIRQVLRNSGMMDTKIASVSAKLTALRFNLRKD